MTTTLDQNVIRPDGIYHPTHSALLIPFELNLMYGNDWNVKREYIEKHLRSSDMEFTKPEDWVICAISYDIVRNSPQRVKDFRKYNPVNPKEHMRILKEWVDKERFGLGNRLGRDPSNEEFNADFKANANDHRHRIVLVLKYPDAYKKKG